MKGLTGPCRGNFPSAMGAETQRKMRVEHGMAVLMPCYGWIRKNWGPEEVTQASQSISVVPLTEHWGTVNLRQVTVVQDSEHCPEQGSLYHARRFQPVAMEKWGGWAVPPLLLE